VLKPGGRFAVSDVVVRGEVPVEIRRSVEAWVGCIAGARGKRIHAEAHRSRIRVRGDRPDSLLRFARETIALGAHFATNGIAIKNFVRILDVA